MDNYETKILRQELETLKLQMADLTAAQNNDRAEAIKAINEVNADMCQCIADIHDLLWPVLHKTFPKYAEIKQQIAAIIKRGGRGAGGSENS